MNMTTMVDLASVLPTVIVAVIGFLIRQMFQSFGASLKRLEHKMDEMVAYQHEQESRITALETALRIRGQL